MWCAILAALALGGVFAARYYRREARDLDERLQASETVRHSDAVRYTAIVADLRARLDRARSG